MRIWPDKTDFKVLLVLFAFSMVCGLVSMLPPFTKALLSYLYDHLAPVVIGLLLVWLVVWTIEETIAEGIRKSR